MDQRGREEWAGQQVSAYSDHSDPKRGAGDFCERKGEQQTRGSHGNIHRSKRIHQD